MKLIRLTAALIALLVVGVAHAGDVRLCWIPPTVNTDGTPLTNLAGYRIHYTAALGPLDRTIEIAVPGISCYGLTGLVPGTWRFAVTAYNTDGRESDFSDMAVRQVDAPPPPPAPLPVAPGSLVVTGTHKVFVIKQTADNIALVAVGTVPAETTCIGTNGVFANGKVYFRVPADIVTWSGSVRSVVVVADCS